MMKTEQGNTGKARCTSTYNKLELWDLLEYINIEKKEALKTVSCKENIPTCIHTSKMYFAGPWFNDKSKAFYDAILEIAKICDCISDYDIFFPRCQVNETPFNAFMKNVGNIQNADMVVAFVDDKDVGTAWEIGMAYSLNKKIVLIGLGASAAVAQDMANKLLRAGCNAIAYSDTHMQAIAVSYMSPGDVLVGISHSGASKDIVESMRAARLGGVTTMCITGTDKSPILKQADIRILTDTEETRHSTLSLSSHISRLMLIDALCYRVVSGNAGRRERYISDNLGELRSKRIEQT